MIDVLKIRDVSQVRPKPSEATLRKLEQQFGKVCALAERCKRRHVEAGLPMPNILRRWYGLPEVKW